MGDLIVREPCLDQDGVPHEPTPNSMGEIECPFFRCGGYGYTSRPASLTDKVAALLEEGVGEVVETYDGLLTGVPQIEISEPGRYLVVRIDGERAPCVHCGDTGWVEDENWSPEFVGETRVEGNGIIRCGAGCGFYEIRSPVRIDGETP